MPVPLLAGLLGVITSALGAAGTAAVAVGSVAVAAGGTIAATTWAVITSAPVLIVCGGAGVAGVAVCTVGSMLEDAERNGREAGVKDGYKKGRIDTAKKFVESTEEHTSKVCGMYALGIYIGLMDGKFDKDDVQVLREVLGDISLQEEYVRAEFDNVKKMTEMNLEVIMKNYINKLGVDSLKDCDRAVKNFVSAYHSRGQDVSSFYNDIWKPYFQDRVKSNKPKANKKSNKAKEN